VDLQQINARRTGGSARRSSREAEPKSPHEIASRSETEDIKQTDLLRSVCRPSRHKASRHRQRTPLDSFQGNLLRQHDVACDETISVPRPCENPKTLDRDGTSYSFKTALGAHTVRLFDCEIELKNIILSRFEFLSFHKPGPKRTLI
jgi:hypothetical protein